MFRIFTKTTPFFSSRLLRHPIQLRASVVPSRIAAAIVATTLGYTAYTYTTSPHPTVPFLNDTPVTSSVKALTLEEANQKLRQEVFTFAFNTGDRKKGRVDIVRVPSNERVEDEWALSMGKGVGGAMSLFAGVYDGHAYVTPR